MGAITGKGGKKYVHGKVSKKVLDEIKESDPKLHEILTNKK